MHGVHLFQFLSPFEVKFRDCFCTFLFMVLQGTYLPKIWASCPPPPAKEIPCSLLDKHDNLLTDPATIRNEYYSEFKHRLRTRDVKTELKWYESFQNDICYLRHNAAKRINSPEFPILELEQVVRELKTGKSMDPARMVREIFKTAGMVFCGYDELN